VAGVERDGRCAMVAVVRADDLQRLDCERSAGPDSLGGASFAPMPSKMGSNPP